MEYEGTVIENSLKDKSILERLAIVKTWDDDDWILHDVVVDEKEMVQIQKALDDGPWYVHFWSNESDEIFVIFKEKSFTIRKSNRDSWEEAISYGLSIGIPQSQLDFLTK